MKTKNEASIKDEHVVDVRNAIEHRATWMYLIMEEARKHGLDWEFARAAINKCGCIHGQRFASGMKNSADMQEFSHVFGADISSKVFEMEVVAADEDRYYLDFHYCPLVKAWQKLGVPEEDISRLCDIAMDGDRGIASCFPEFKFTLKETIAEGKPACQIRFDKEK